MSPIAIDYRTQYEAAEERIRELEAKTGHQHSQIYILDERIAKAREILTELWTKGHMLIQDYESIMDALEGK